VNPYAIAVMEDDGINISLSETFDINQCSEKNYDFVITLSDEARRECPEFLGNTGRLHCDFPDPESTGKSSEDKWMAYYAVRDMLKDYANEVYNEYL
jgi:arsenate reductase (thioredoxin)